MPRTQRCVVSSSLFLPLSLFLFLGALAAPSCFPRRCFLTLPDAPTQVNDYNFVPDRKLLAERLKNCLQESEDVPKDFTTLFSQDLFKFDMSLVPDAVKLYSVPCCVV